MLQNKKKDDSKKETFIQHNVFEVKENTHPEINHFIVPPDIMNCGYNNITTNNTATDEKLVITEKSVGEKRVQK